MSVPVPVAPMWKLGWEREKKRKKERILKIRGNFVITSVV